MVRAHLVGILVPVVLLGCAPHNMAQHASFDTNLITEDEIVASRATTAFEAIRKLRGNFLSNRGVTTIYATNSSPFPTVYVDGQRYGDGNILLSIPAEVISTIRLYRAWEATTRYGMGNMGGVIAITTRQGGDKAAAYRH
ncbi:MAG: TonB-dependent receptor plug domain-containing protein [Gemmatimonadaceae bacterium]|nr:TonB-dependent receptor plug domain-containing protein [Gemmatimonadaceae bacterium]